MKNREGSESTQTNGRGGKMKAESKNFQWVSGFIKEKKSHKCNKKGHWIFLTTPSSFWRTADFQSTVTSHRPCGQCKPPFLVSSPIHRSLAQSAKKREICSVLEYQVLGKCRSVTKFCEGERVHLRRWLWTSQDKIPTALDCVASGTNPRDNRASSLLPVWSKGS